MIISATRHKYLHAEKKEFLQGLIVGEDKNKIYYLFLWPDKYYTQWCGSMTTNSFVPFLGLKLLRGKENIKVSVQPPGNSSI